jgi:hypothetical protein
MDVFEVIIIKRRGLLLNTLASYLGGSGFKYRLGGRFYLSASRQALG